MAVFEKTKPLVMMPLCSAPTAADKTVVLVAMTRSSYCTRRSWIVVRHAKAVRVKAS